VSGRQATTRRPRAAAGGTSEIPPLMVCEDGPYAGQWYYVADWEAKVGAARWHVEQGCASQLDDCPSRRALTYEPSGRRPLHPFYGFAKVDGRSVRTTEVRGAGYIYAPTRVTPVANPGTL
jgi:hypothetical protein